MPDAQENLYTNLKTLIWGAFVGIVSFQILGPNLATAIHKQMGWSEQCAYDVFSTLYLVLPSIICLFLIWRDFHLFKKYLHPFGKDELDWLSKALIWGVVGLWTVQLVATVFFLFADERSAPYWIFRLLTIIECFGCGALMVFGTQLAALKFRHVHAVAVADKRYFFQLKATCFIIFILLSFFIYNYIHQNGKKGFLLNDLHDQGFALKEKKENLEDGLRHIAHLTDVIRLYCQLDSLQKKQAPASHIRVTFEPGFASARDTLHNIGVRLALADDQLYHVLRAIGDKVDVVVHDTLRRPDLLAFFNTINGWRSGISSRSSHVAGLVDTLNLLEGLLPDSVGFASDASKQKAGNDSANIQLQYGNYLRNLQVVTTHLAGMIDNEIKREIGDQLRYTQLIGTTLFVGLFFSLLALYLFVKMNSRLTDTELKHQKAAKRRLTATGGHSSERENVDIIKEREAEESSGLSNNIWLMITIIVWLLLPFLKPIDDDKIDLADPFKTLTFSDPGSSLNPTPPGSDPPKPFRFDTVITVVTHQVDSMRVVPYLKDSLINRRIVEHDTVYRVLRLDTADLRAQFDSLNNRLDYLVPRKKNNTPKR